MKVRNAFTHGVWAPSLTWSSESQRGPAGRSVSVMDHSGGREQDRWGREGGDQYCQAALKVWSSRSKRAMWEEQTVRVLMASEIRTISEPPCPCSGPDSKTPRINRCWCLASPSIACFLQAVTKCFIHGFALTVTACKVVQFQHRATSMQMFVCGSISYPGGSAGFTMQIVW